MPASGCRIGRKQKCLPTVRNVSAAGRAWTAARITATSAAAPEFFFQAEDGIRDYKVTGVQTCALPISRSWRFSSRYWQEGKRHDLALALAGVLLRAGWSTKDAEHFIVAAARVAGDNEIEIGRASCRERV